MPLWGATASKEIRAVSGHIVTCSPSRFVSRRKYRQAVDTASVYETVVSFAENGANCANRHAHLHAVRIFFTAHHVHRTSARSRDSTHFSRRGLRRLKVIRTNSCSGCLLSSVVEVSEARRRKIK